MADFGYCFDCKEMNYAMTDANGRFERANMSNNHQYCEQHTFGEPNKYVPPIRNVLMKLNAGLPISNNDIVFFKMAIDLGELDKFRKKKRGT